MSHGLITAAILLVALACYGLGLWTGALALLIGGAVLEFWLWARAFPGFGVLSRNRSRKSH